MLDIDALFEKYFVEFVKNNTGKYSEEELEDLVGQIYKEFGNKPLTELNGVSPIEYYKKMSDKELVEALNACINDKIAVSDYLCDEIGKRPSASEYLLKNVSSSVSDELASYSLNLLNENCELTADDLIGFVNLLCEGKTGESLTEIITETLKDNADKVKEEILGVYGENKDLSKYFDEILSETTPSDERVLKILTDGLIKGDNIGLYSAYLTKYNDDSVLPVLNDLAMKTVSYIDYKELKLAIEALGGEIEYERDFSSDPYFKKIKNNLN